MNNQFDKEYTYIHTAESLLRKAARYGIKIEIKHTNNKIRITVYMDEIDFRRMP
jgi:hypothetical protein